MNSKSGQQVILGMSGGVDSSVAAVLLLEAGYQVEGLFMRNWEEDDGTEYCTAKEDLADAQAVCDQLGILLHRANFAAEYWDNVFEHFLSEYQAGRTPNPDILCNREIKFKAFMDYALHLGANLIATGHYARLDRQAGRTRLLKAIDSSKDQSYFLQAVTEAQLAKSLFPLGGLLKSEVRSIARDNGFKTHNKKDSTGICFIGERRFNDFLATYLPASPGEIVTTTGEVIGEHQGLMFHTLGQRQGLGIGGLAQYPEQPWYVVEKDIGHNRLVVAQGNDNPALFCESVVCRTWSWIDGEGIELPDTGHARIRYRQADQACRLIDTDDGICIDFEVPQRAATPGQWACFYQGDWCLGGGIITTTRAHPATATTTTRGAFE